MKNQKPKLIVTDLDRTLLRSDKTISSYTAAALCRCKDNGIKLAFATARPIRTVQPYLEQIPFDAGIYHNGALVYVNGALIASHSIDIDCAKKLLMQIKESIPESKLACEMQDTLYADFDVSGLWSNKGVVRSGFSDLPNNSVDKIMVSVDSLEQANTVRSMLPDHMYMHLADRLLCMIMVRNATKIKAVETVARCFGFGLDDIIAFGDDLNDIEMLIGCGTGVAMDNGGEQAKAVADYVCAANDDDGIAKWIETYLKV